MKLIRLSLIGVFLLSISFSSFAYCRATILCTTNKGKVLKKIHLRTYRHGFLFIKCSVSPQDEKYLMNVTLQKQLCEQKVKHCQEHGNCKTRLIFRKSWPFFGHL